MSGSRSSSGNQPWVGMIDKINETIEYMYAGFDNAFAEAQKDVKPREFIKRAFFRKVWKELTLRSQFGSLAELDAYYKNIHFNLHSYLSDFVLDDLIKSICREHNIVPGPNEISVISHRKLMMLEKIISLYHALSRNRFIITKLSGHLSVDRDKLSAQVNDDKERLFDQLTEDKLHLEQQAAEEKEKLPAAAIADRKKIDDWAANELEKLGNQFEEDRARLDGKQREDQYFITSQKCEDMVAFLYEQSQVNNELAHKIDIEKYRVRSLNALRTLNQRLTDTLQKRGYGSIDTVVTPSTDKNHHPELYKVYAAIDELPPVAELIDIVNGKAYDSKDMRAHKLAEHIVTIQKLRYVLQQTRDNVLPASERNVTQLIDEYDFLNVVNKVDYISVLTNFFHDLDDLEQSMHKKSSDNNSFPTLLAALREAAAECNKQSQMEQYTRIVNNGWGVANSAFCDRILKILNTAKAEVDAYSVSRDQFSDEVKTKVDQLTSRYKQLMDFINEWKTENEETRRVLEQCDALLAHVEATLTSASQTLGQFIWSFGKRHWVEIGIISTVCLASAIAVPLAVASATTLAATVPAAAVGGPALGAGIGVARDKKASHLVPPVVLSDAAKASSDIDAQFINKRLFDPPATPVSAEEVVVRKKKFILPALNDTHRSAPRPAAVNQNEFRLSLPDDAVPSPVNQSPKDDRPLVLTKEREALAANLAPPADAAPASKADAASSTFMDTISNVPGVLVGLPMQMVTFTTNIPSQVVNLPSRVAALPGLFSARQGQGTTAAASPADQSAGVKPK